MMFNSEINLYSDTQTKPCPDMRAAMAKAEVGDEQRGEDPTINALCGRVADLLGKQAAVFLPSGTMCNEIALMVHCNRGDEVFCDRTAHIMGFEGGAPAALAGAMMHAIDGERGIFTADQLRQTIRPQNRYSPPARLVSIEQTSNGGGGSIWPIETIRAVASVARENNMKLHMDGARLLNAVARSGIAAQDYAAPFDSVWIDLSKGLGCPIGGVLAGTADFIEAAWRWKQAIGGAMRQAGIIAAAGLYALDHNLDQLAADNENAKLFAEIVAAADGFDLDPTLVETNIVYFQVSKQGVDVAGFLDRLRSLGVRIGAMGPALLRAVLHRDVSRQQAIDAAKIIAKQIEVEGGSN